MAASTVYRAGDVLTRLRKVHGITPADVVAILEAEKRRQLRESRDGQQAAAKQLTKFLTGRGAERLLRKLRRGTRPTDNIAALKPFADMLRRNLKVERLGRKAAPARRALLPLVEFFTAHTGKPLRKNAAELIAAAFPEFERADSRKSVYDNLKPSTPRERFEIPPLHIANKPISRAAAQLIIEQARDDVVDMRVEKLPQLLKPHAKAAAVAVYRFQPLTRKALKEIRRRQALKRQKNTR